MRPPPPNCTCAWKVNDPACPFHSTDALAPIPTPATNVATVDAETLAREMGIPAWVPVDARDAWWEAVTPEVKTAWRNGAAIALRVFAYSPLPPPNRAPADALTAARETLTDAYIVLRLVSDELDKADPKSDYLHELREQETSAEIEADAAWADYLTACEAVRVARDKPPRS